ncbi:MAG: hypothetical protein JWS12_981 [Candidatus Saccharibacteria bacterium]|nr:hypothetical protein [Candidatus Saccharibacteria bacterium]
MGLYVLGGVILFVSIFLPVAIFTHRPNFALQRLEGEYELLRWRESQRRHHQRRDQ